MQAIWTPRMTKRTPAGLVALAVTLVLTIVLLVAAMSHNSPVPMRTPAAAGPTTCQAAGFTGPCS